jgi:hypothetical protein
MLASRDTQVIHNHVQFFEKEGKGERIPEEWKEASERNYSKMRQKGKKSHTTRKRKREEEEEESGKGGESTNKRDSEAEDKRRKEQNRQGKEDLVVEGQEFEEMEVEVRRKEGGTGEEGGCLNCGRLKKGRVKRKENFLSKEKFEKLEKLARKKMEEMKGKENEFGIDGAVQYNLTKEEVAFMHEEIMEWIGLEGFKDADYTSLAILFSLKSQVSFSFFPSLFPLLSSFLFPSLSPPSPSLPLPPLPLSSLPTPPTLPTLPTLSTLPTLPFLLPPFFRPSIWIPSSLQ